MTTSINIDSRTMSTGASLGVAQWLQSIEATSPNLPTRLLSPYVPPSKRSQQPRPNLSKRLIDVDDSNSDKGDDETVQRGRNRKRRCQQVRTSGYLPSSPPLTMPLSDKRPASSEIPLEPERSKGSLLTYPDDVTLFPAPKSRSRSTSPTKRAALEQWEKPVHFHSLEGCELPADLLDLHERLFAAQEKEAVIPHEVEDRIKSLRGKTRPRHFRQSATSGASATFEKVHELLQDADYVRTTEHHECGWNHWVLTPLLRMVFNGRRPASSSPMTSPATLLVPCMTAGIRDAYVPVKSMPARNRVDELRPESQAGRESDYSTGTRRAGDNRKVDYAVCLRVQGSKLSEVMNRVATKQGLLEDVLPHVNQTLYVPLQWDPIAVTIETKVGKADTMPQLGAWAAAWHKRMALHQRYVRQQPQHQIDGVGRQDAARIPSIVLLEIQGDEWSIYFASDRDGTDIDIYGPMIIGSTLSFADIYAVLSALEAIRTWVTSTYRREMERFFASEEPDQPS